MQNPFRIKTKKSIQQVLSDQNFENTQFFISLISPWADSHKKAKQTEELGWNQFFSNGEQPQYLRPIRNFQISLFSNQRIKTEESKNFSVGIRDDRISNLSSLFATKSHIRRDQTTSLALKRVHHLKNRQKLTTPVVNINDFSFNESKSKKRQMRTIVPKIDVKFDRSIKSYEFKPDWSSSKQSCNSSSINLDVKQFRKQSAQKVIPFNRMPQRSKSKKFKNDIQRLYGGHGALINNLRKMAQIDSKPETQEIKCRSLNKFRKTIC